MLSFLKRKRPNVIMILMDGARHNTLEKVPYYNELKKEGVFFSQMITYAPYTIASLHATFSGVYGNKNGVDGYYKAFSFKKKECFTLPQYLKEQGYYTEGDLIRGDTVPSQGFDKLTVHDEFNDDLVERHSEILTRIKGKLPFYLFLDYSKLHTSLVSNVIKKYTDFDEEYFKNKDKNLESYIKYLEASAVYLKSIINKIKELGLWENSIIIVFNDHGASIGDKVGEKAYGSYLYDYTIKCFLYAIGNGFTKGLEVNGLVRSIDIMPTLLDALGIKEKSDYMKMQGKTFLPLIKGKKDERTSYSETGGLGGPTPSPEKHNVKCVRNSKWKLIINETSGKNELYNLEDDPEENISLIGKFPEIENYLMGLLDSEQ
ncbi:MAG: sulfatase-like hydrolase/transferase [Nanoarchaeota archaeon]